MPSITLETHNIYMPASGGTKTVSISCVDCTPTGIIYSTNFSITTGFSGNSAITLTFAANTNVAQLNGWVWVDAIDTNGDYYEDFASLNQNGLSYSVYAQGEDVFDAEAQTGTFNITSSFNGTYSADAVADWITVESITKTGSNAATLVISMTENTTGERRQGMVHITGHYQYNPYTATTTLMISQTDSTGSGGGGGEETYSKISYSPNAGNVSYTAGSHTSPVPEVTNVTGLPMNRCFRFS